MLKFPPSEIICMEPGGQEARKAPTVVLMDNQGKFKAFGSNALDLYYGGDDGYVFCNYGENGYMLFEKFKMVLNSSDIRSYKATALNGEFIGCEYIHDTIILKELSRKSCFGY
jgi:hypothetical protein